MANEKVRVRLLTPDDRTEILRRYREGETATALGRAFGCTMQSIQYHLRLAGVTSRDRTVLYKTCTKCGEKKSAEAFTPDSRCKAGFTQPCKKCGRGPSALKSRQRQLRLRRQVLDAYGNRCACCGERTPEFLTVDHINNDGAAHRKAVTSGYSFYRWLARHGFPQDCFQLLCWNCNCAKGRYGECPHKRREG